MVRPRGQLQMIERIEFSNYKALRSAVLPLGQFTLIVGPNGSGKTTALRSLDSIRALGPFAHGQAVHAGVSESERSKSIYCHSNVATVGITHDVGISISWGEPDRDCVTRVIWQAPSTFRFECIHRSGNAVDGAVQGRMNTAL